MTVEQRIKWDFQATDRGWIWRAVDPDGSERVSASEFPTLKACASDAAANGYVAWKAEDERRRDQKLAVIESLRRAAPSREP